MHARMHVQTDPNSKDIFLRTLFGGPTTWPILARLGSKDMQLNLKSQGAQDFGINIFFQDTFRNIKFSSYVSVKFLSWI